VLSFAGAGNAPDGRYFLGELGDLRALWSPFEAGAQGQIPAGALGAHDGSRGTALAWIRSRTALPKRRKWHPARFKSLIGLGFQTRICDPVCSAPMSEQPHGGTNRPLVKAKLPSRCPASPVILRSWSRHLREASERGLFDGDALVMLEGVLAVADMQGPRHHGAAFANGVRRA